MTAYSYVTGIPVEELMERIGHRGEEEIFNAPWPYSLRNFHPQEILDVLFPEFDVVEVTVKPVMNDFTIPVPHDRLERYLKYDGVLEGWGRGYHALAVIDGKFYDPDTGRECENYISPDVFYLVRRNDQVQKDNCDTRAD